MTTRLVVATRSHHKLAEIIEMAGDIDGLEIIGLDEAGVAPSAEEASIEVFDTFEENALAKARYYAERAGASVLADDSGLCVDALDGEPGVHSKRFSGRPDLDGQALDDANNELLQERLRGLPTDERTARYVCVLALVTPAGEEIFRGTVEGVIVDAPRGRGGFGYDPYFYVPFLEATFAEVPPEVKNLHSHRGDAFRSARAALQALAKQPAVKGLR